MRRTPRHFRQRIATAAVELGNLVRRVVVAASVGAQWAIEGYETDDAVEGVDDELVDVFAGLYVYGRPAAADDAEALLVHVGGKADHPAIAALRNEDARRRYVDEHGDPAAGELAIFNTLGTVRILVAGDGTVSIEADNGAAASLALKSDVQEVIDAIAGAATAAGDGGATFKSNIGVAIGISGTPTGTSVLKGE